MCNSNKWNGIPEDPDTKILRRKIGSVLDHECLIENWSWDGFEGYGYIFMINDINDDLPSVIDQVSKLNGNVIVETKNS